MDTDDAFMTAERLRREIRSMRIVLDHEKRVTVSISLGVAQLRNSDDADTLFARADAALYQAKEKGRNQAVAAP